MGTKLKLGIWSRVDGKAKVAEERKTTLREKRKWSIPFANSQLLSFRKVAVTVRTEKREMSSLGREFVNGAQWDSLFIGR